MIGTAIRLVLAPRTRLAALAAAPVPLKELYRDWVMPLAAIPAVAGFVGAAVVGYALPLAHGAARVNPFAALVGATVGWALSVLLVPVLGLAVAALAPRFDTPADTDAATRLVAYAFTPVWLAGAALALPPLAGLAVLGLWGAMVFHAGLPAFLPTPEARRTGFTVAAVCCGVIGFAVVGSLLRLMVPGAYR